MAEEAHDGGDDGVDVREQDHLLPIANIGRIMKNGVPPSAKISKDAKETVQECVSEFISFVTSEANEKCVQEKRKTINGDDIIWALKNLGFDNYVEPLSLYLNRYKEVVSSELAAGGDSRGGVRRKQDDADHADGLGNGGMRMHADPAYGAPPAHFQAHMGTANGGGEVNGQPAYMAGGMGSGMGSGMADDGSGAGASLQPMDPMTAPHMS